MCGSEVRYRHAEEASGAFPCGIRCTVTVSTEVGLGSILAFLACLLPIGLFVLAINYWLAKRLSEKLAKPILVLISSIRQNEMGNLNYIQICGSELEEIETLSNSYRSMMTRINELMEKNQKDNLLRIENQLDALQEKINPHFLFNTLELISSQAILEDAERTAMLIQKLGVLFRYSLRAPDIIPLHREIQYARDYLHLQNALFNGLITCSYEISSQTENLLLPKLTLQPLLENCFRHGFRDWAGRPCRLRLTAQVRREELLITVEDDGIGIPPEQKAEMEETWKKDRENFACFVNRGNHIGLRNVNARLCLHYHVEQALWIGRSELGGARILIRLPCAVLREGGEHDAEGLDC